MEKYIKVKVKKAFFLPSGRKAAAGTVMEVPADMAKYLLLNGKAEHAKPCPPKPKTAETKAEPAVVAGTSEGKPKTEEPKGAKK